MQSLLQVLEQKLVHADPLGKPAEISTRKVLHLVRVDLSITWLLEHFQRILLVQIVLVLEKIFQTVHLVKLLRNLRSLRDRDLDFSSTLDRLGSTLRVFVQTLSLEVFDIVKHIFKLKQVRLHSVTVLFVPVFEDG